MTTTALPHWDLTPIYPGLDSPEFKSAFQSVVQSIDELVVLFDRHTIMQRDPAPLDDGTTAAFEEVMNRYNQTLEEMTTLRSYIYGFVTTDSRDTLAQAAQSELQQRTMPLALLSARFVAWIGSLDVDALIDSSEIARAHSNMLKKARQRAAHLMSPAEEALAVELGLTGGVAWSRLYGTFSSQLLVPVELDGRTQELPMSAVRNLATHPDRETRKRAYEAEVITWKYAATPIAAALNSIKGEVNTLSKRRKWATPLDAALFENSIDRATLDAMLGTARAAFPDFRRYLRAKARALGIPALTWYDLFAPVDARSGVWTYEQAEQFIAEQFGTFSSKLRDLAERSSRERWVDAEPRPGKRDGAFCMSVRPGESRVLMNYKPAFNAVSTLAHELGHAYHNLSLAKRTPLQRSTPMTLAETASIFCETIVVQAALQQSSPQEQFSILEASLQSNCQVVVDITSRFVFEQQVFENRQQRDLSINEFCELMLDAQRQTYGDGLDPDVLHPYMWAVKPHYYGSSFYNYPYMFGLLFGLGLYARYRQDPTGFKTGYDELLSSTGMYDAAELAAQFGIDIRSQDFWASSLDVIRADIDRFEALVDQRRAGHN
jgi:pepF/M3 family oligoendopeptidase